MFRKVPNALTYGHEVLAMQFLGGGGGCLICGKAFIRHTPRRFERCMTTPLDIRITDQGRARLDRHQDRRP